MRDDELRRFVNGRLQALAGSIDGTGGRRLRTRLEEHRADAVAELPEGLGVACADVGEGRMVVRTQLQRARHVPPSLPRAW